MTKDEARAAVIQATREFAESITSYQADMTEKYTAKLDAIEPFLKDFTKSEHIGMAAEMNAILEETLK